MGVYIDKQAARLDRWADDAERCARTETGSGRRQWLGMADELRRRAAYLRGEGPAVTDRRFV